MAPAVLVGERHWVLARAQLPLAAQRHAPDDTAVALATSRAGTGQRPGLQQPQSARAARLGATHRLRGRPRRDPRLAEGRTPQLLTAAPGVATAPAGEAAARARRGTPAPARPPGDRPW